MDTIKPNTFRIETPNATVWIAYLARRVRSITTEALGS